MCISLFILIVDNLTILEIIHTAVASFNPDSFFDMRALYFLEEAGIPVMSMLNNYTHYIQKMLGLPMTCNQDLFNYWISSVWQVSPTWKNLLDILRILNLDDLAQQIESYLSGATDLSPAGGSDGTKEIYIPLIRDTIPGSIHA